MKKMIMMLAAALCSLFTWQAVGATTEVASASALSTAISDASDGDIIKLTADITISSAITVSKSVTIDMSGRTITVSGPVYAFSVNGTGKTFKIDGGAARGAFKGQSKPNGVVQISGGSGGTKIVLVNIDINGGSSSSAFTTNGSTSTGVFQDTNGNYDSFVLTNVNVKTECDIMTGSSNRSSASVVVIGGTYETTKRGFRFCGASDSQSVIAGANISSGGGIAIYSFSNTTLTNSTISATAGGDAIYCSGSVHGNGKTTLTIEADTVVSVSAKGGAFAAEGYGTVVVNAGYFKNKGDGNKVANIATSGGTLKIHGGEFHGILMSDGDNNSSSGKHYAKTYIDGGTFYGTSSGCFARRTPSDHDVCNQYYLTGGVFDHAPGDYELQNETGYEAKPNTPSAGWWTVQKKGAPKYSISVTCGLGVSGGTFTVDGTSYGFGATGVEAEAGKTVAITSITYKDYFESNGKWDSKSVSLTSDGISWVVDAQAKTYPVSVKAGDNVTGGRFTIDGGDEYNFGATGLTATNGAAVVVKEVYCATGYESSTAVPFTCEWTGSGDGRCIATVVTAKKQSYDVKVACGAHVTYVAISVGGTGLDTGDGVITTNVEAGVTIEITAIDYESDSYGPSGDLRVGYTTNVTGKIDWTIVGEEKSTTFSVTATAGTGVTSGKFAVGNVTNDFGTAMTDVADGSKVEIVVVNYVLGYEQSGEVVKGFTTNVTGKAIELTAVGTKVESGAAPKLPEDVKPQEAGITSEEFKDVQPAKVKEIVKWQASYSADGANINAAEFTTDPASGEKVPANDQAEAYLLDCAPTTAEIANSKTNFTAEISIDADGLPVVNVTGKAADATTYGNGKLIKLGAAELQNAEWSTDLTNAKFFKFELVK